MTSDTQTYITSDTQTYMTSDTQTYITSDTQTYITADMIIDSISNASNDNTQRLHTQCLYIPSSTMYWS